MRLFRQDQESAEMHESNRREKRDMRSVTSPWVSYETPKGIYQLGFRGTPQSRPSTPATRAPCQASDRGNESENRRGDDLSMIPAV